MAERAKKPAKKRTSRPGTRAVNKVKFKYVFGDDYNPVYANGAHGGLTSQGELCLNFFLERNAIPYSETVAVDGTRLGEPIERQPAVNLGEATVVRYITCGVVMTPATARRLRDFIDSQLAFIEAQNPDVLQQ